MSSQPVSAEVYYRDIYWNDHDRTLEYLTRLVNLGLQEQSCWWPEYFRNRYAQNKPFERALVLNCGNGWVERELYDFGIAKEFVAFDYSEDLLVQARELGGDRNFTYLQADCNSVWFPEDSFDLVVNVAAMHHVQWINRMHCMIANCLTPDGLFLNFDYVGPHRNQYGQKQFGDMLRINAALPSGFRKDPLHYPDMYEMVRQDPTEAIHAELILPLFERFFYPVERKDLNGGIAYQIMHNNHELFVEGMRIADESVQFLLELDELSGVCQQFPPLFSFFVGRPRKVLFDDIELLSRYAAEEVEREQRAAARGGIYEHSVSS